MNKKTSLGQTRITNVENLETVGVSIASQQRKKLQQAGITLVALVVTIIVLLILAGVTITLALNNNGILGRAQYASNSWANATKDEETAMGQFSSDVDSLTAGFINREGGSGDGSTGLEEQADGTFKDTNNNEWVWIEVPNNGTGPIYPENATDDQIETALRTYCSDIITIGTTSDSYTTTTKGFTDTWYDGCGLSENEYNTTKSKMLNSIKENGGFYIGKYETGYEGSTIRTASGEITQAAVIKQNVYPYNWVTCSQAESLAKGFATDGKTSSLLFGIQWDLVLKYINEKGIKTVAQLTNDSTSWGNYYNNDSTNGTFSITSENAKSSSDNGETWSPIAKDIVKSSPLLLTTGSSASLAPLNIYDLAGNVLEMTLEKAYTGDGSLSLRGGYYYDEGDCLYGPASYRNGGNPNWPYFLIRLSCGTLLVGHWGRSK